jgi:hypothetical protein
VDTSEQYIKMCDCPEIQDGWKPKPGDFTSEGIVMYLYCSPLYMGVRTDTAEIFRIIKEGEKVIWLPRQDQLQEMAYPDGKMAIDQLGNVVSWFNHIARSYVWQFGESREQLWLAFVMWEKFSKKWDGEKWTQKEE